jgi:hypothetical protein
LLAEDPEFRELAESASSFLRWYVPDPDASASE